jgi:hypothetical protein
VNTMIGAPHISYSQHVTWGQRSFIIFIHLGYKLMLEGSDSHNRIILLATTCMYGHACSTSVDMQASLDLLVLFHVQLEFIYVFISVLHEIVRVNRATHTTRQQLHAAAPVRLHQLRSSAYHRATQPSWRAIQARSKPQASH